MKKILLCAALLVATVALRAQKMGVCTSISNGAALAAAGGQYIEESVQKFLVPDKDEATFEGILEQAKALPIPVMACNMFLPGAMKLFGDQAVSRERLIEWGQTAFRRAAKAGVKIVVFGCSGSRKIPEGTDRGEATEYFVGLMSDYAAMAQKNGVMLVLEPVNRTEVNFINTIEDAVAIVKRVNNPNFKCLADFYHMVMNGESASEIVKYKKYLYHMHVSEKVDRAPLGTHGDDLSAYFDAVKKIGYTGGISMESKFTDFDTQIGPAMAVFKRNLE